MNLKTEIVALAVRALADKTNLIRKPDAFEELFGALFTGKTYDQRLAEDIVADADKLASAAKRFKTNRQAKKNTLTV